MHCRSSKFSGSWGTDPILSNSKKTDTTAEVEIECFMETQDELNKQFPFSGTANYPLHLSLTGIVSAFHCLIPMYM